MKKIIITSLALFVFATAVHAEPPAEPIEQTDEMVLTEKQKLVAQLRTLKKLGLDRQPEKPKTETPAEEVSAANVEKPEFGIEDLYPNQPAPKLDPSTRQAVAQTKQWLHRTTTPIVQKGKIIHPYGDGVPTLVIPPVGLSNILLNPDETITHKGIQLADAVNWSVTETYAGSREGKRPNLVVKSKSLEELKTILIIATTKRTYHINLVSNQGEWTPELMFSYESDSIERSPETIARLLAEAESEKPKPDAPVDSYLYAAGDIDFNFHIEGDQKIMPSRVFSLGHQTVIEMDESIAAVNLPALMLEDDEGNEEIVNCRFVNGRYILDQPIHIAHLISGVGWDQQKVTIKKLEAN